MKQSTAYFLLCIIGIVIPWFFLVGFLGEPQPTIALFFSAIFTNQVTSSVAADLSFPRFFAHQEAAVMLPDSVRVEC